MNSKYLLSTINDENRKEWKDNFRNNDFVVKEKGTVSFTHHARKTGLYNSWRQPWLFCSNIWSFDAIIAILSFLVCRQELVVGVSISLFLASLFYSVKSRVTNYFSSDRLVCQCSFSRFWNSWLLLVLLSFLHSDWCCWCLSCDCLFYTYYSGFIVAVYCCFYFVVVCGCCCWCNRREERVCLAKREAGFLVWLGNDEVAHPLGRTHTREVRRRRSKTGTQPLGVFGFDFVACSRSWNFWLFLILVSLIRGFSKVRNPKEWKKWNSGELCLGGLN